jgi:hypothetical protein
MTLAEKINRLLCRFLLTHKFVFRFDIYTGAEGEPGEIYVENVVEYEFINSGTTKIVINAGLTIYPAYAGIEPTRVKLAVNHNERDETIYKYEFFPLGGDQFSGDDYRIVIDTAAGTGGFAVTPLDVPTPVFIGEIIPGITNIKAPAYEINKLVVISKERYIPETMHEENPVIRKKKK